MTNVTEGQRCWVYVERDGQKYEERGYVVGLAAVDAEGMDKDLNVVIRLDCDFGLMRVMHFSRVKTTLVDLYEANSLLCSVRRNDGRW